MNTYEFAHFVLRLNRLKNGFYSEPNATNPGNGNFDEYLTYDLNGNINTLKRKAIPVSGQTSALVDDLEYKYTGNRLNQVIESAMNDTGYEGGNNMIDYDANGNMTTMKDKGINSIVYNHLNLPDQFSIKQKLSGWDYNTDISHLYRADGTKLRTTKYSAMQGDIGDTTTTDYLDGFQYRYYDNGLDGGLLSMDKTSFAYEEQAYAQATRAMFPAQPKWQLDFVPTSEGFYSFTENRYIYQYKDHLGNSRVSFAKNSAGVLEVTDTNNYYPFGLNHIGGLKGLIGGYKSYKYNGKELQETGMYDYGARFYMPDLGRWGVVDLLAEKMRRWSPYNYAFDNPVKFIDPDGRSPLKIGNPESTDAKRLQNALSKTQTGRETWQKMVDSENTIYIHYVGNSTTQAESKYLSQSGANGETMTGKMYNELQASGNVSSKSMDTMGTFNEETGEYNKTDDWKDTHIVLSENQVDIGNAVGESLYGEKGNLMGDLKTGGEEAIHSIQNSLDFNQKTKNPSTGKFIENQNTKPYNERQHEIDAKEKAQQMINELIN